MKFMRMKIKFGTIDLSLLFIIPAVAAIGFFKAKYPESESLVNCKKDNWSDEPLVEVWCKPVSAMENKKSNKENGREVDVLKSSRKTLGKNVSGTQNYR